MQSPKARGALLELPDSPQALHSSLKTHSRAHLTSCYIWQPFDSWIRANVFVMLPFSPLVKCVILKLSFALVCNRSRTARSLVFTPRNGCM